MTRPKGDKPKRRMKPRVDRTPAEVEVDRAFMLSVALRMGSAFTITAAGDALNERRYRVACDRAEVAGKPKPERGTVELGASVIARDYHAVMDRIRATQEGAAALFVDQQIEAVERDIKRTEDLDEAIMEDLERSRNATKQIVHADSNYQDPPQFVGRRVTTEKAVNGPADPALYAALHRNLATRQKLRQELRALRLGREYLAKMATSKSEPVSFVEAISGQGEPRALLVEAYEREVQALLTADAESMAAFGPELARAEAARARRRLERIRALETAMKIPSGTGKPDRFEFAVVGIDEGG